MQHIESLILEGSLRHGTPLLPERELAECLNVSRPTLRDALKTLEQKGLLTSRPGKGMRVAHLGAATISDPLIAMLTEHSAVSDDYLEFRAIVESSAAAFAAERASEIDLEQIRQCLVRIEQAHIAGEPQEEAAADTELHMTIYEASHNLVLLQIMQALSGNLMKHVFHNRQKIFSMPETRDVLRRQHIAIAEAIIGRRPEEARAAAHEHICYLRKAISDIQQDEAKNSLALRRRQGGGIGRPRS